ncbi:MAG: RNA polymerase sigma factor [Planctomycetales bacterium]|nr:RNA polymerase sigma factor [Planctomycetales bacterium]
MSAPLAERLVAAAPDLWRFARHLGAEGADAEDLVQETLARAWAARERIRPDANPRPFLFAILANARRDAWRRARHAEDPLATPDERAAPPAPAASAAAIGDLKDRLPDDVWRAIRELPPGYAAVLFLVAVQGLSGREAAQVLGWPEGTVRSAYSRARAAIRSRLAGRPPGR